MTTFDNLLDGPFLELVGINRDRHDHLLGYNIVA
jgi:hypothetical protein